MTLLEFARGPAIEWALIIFFVGIFIRLFGVLFMLRNPVLSKPRDENFSAAGWKTIFSRFKPAAAFEKRIRLHTYAGYIWHISFLITLLFFELHILFFKSLFGLSWPGLPNSFILISGVITIAILIALLIRRTRDPVLRLISSPDDYISLVVTLMPVITGIMAYAHMWLRYETMLGLHILSIAILLIWFPFGKLMHAILVFPSRYQQGVKFGRRGVKA